MKISITSSGAVYFSVRDLVMNKSRENAMTDEPMTEDKFRRLLERECDTLEDTPDHTSIMLGVVLTSLCVSFVLFVMWCVWHWSVHK